jgi:hypothetical protein
MSGERLAQRKVVEGKQGALFDLFLFLSFFALIQRHCTVRLEQSRNSLTPIDEPLPFSLPRPSPFSKKLADSSSSAIVKPATTSLSQRASSNAPSSGTRVYISGIPKTAKWSTLEDRFPSLQGLPAPVWKNQTSLAVTFPSHEVATSAVAVLQKSTSGTFLPLLLIASRLSILQSQAGSSRSKLRPLLLHFHF